MALVGGMGWSIISLFSYRTTMALPQYNVVREVAPEWAWEFITIMFGALQLWGLFDHRVIVLRLFGALGLGTAFMAITLGLLFGPGPMVPSVATYAACATIEFCAVILLTAVVMRNMEKGENKWTTLH